MNNKLTIKIFFTVICFGILAFFCGMLGAGPNGYAQQYELDINNDALINSIERLKRENTAFIPLQNYAETDSLDTLTSHFNVHFYYRDKNTIVYFFINGKHGITGKSFINHKLINKDFDRNENLRVKKEFEERILKKLRFPYKDKGNGMFIFWK
jgi:hypothetical protein